MGHADRPEEEGKGYEGCSESEGESDVDLTGRSQVQLLWCTSCCFSCHFSFHYICCQAGKHIRKKSSARKTHGRRIEGTSKLSASTDLMPFEVKCNYCCQFPRYVLLSICKIRVCMNVCYISKAWYIPQCTRFLVKQ